MAEFTHYGMVSKNGRKKLKLRKSVKNWHCENGCIFDPINGTQTNGNRSGFLEIDTLQRIK